MKTILIAIPTNKHIEPETFKSIYDLIIPDGYKAEFQFFHGYCIDQIRNLIASWAARYDYLFAVDSDMEFGPLTLAKLLSHNVDIVSGLYIQRKPGEHILEIYRNGFNVPYQEIEGRGLVEIDACGFGCVLINSNVIRKMEYPHFVYKSALDHKDTVSEDVYFCMKAKSVGAKIYADTSILCSHIGAAKFVIQSSPKDSVFDRLLELSNQRLLPQAHVQYLHNMSANGIKPKVIYDIGACVLHWTREAVNIWPEAQYFAFEAMPESEKIFNHFGVPHHIGVLSDSDDDYVTFMQNTYHPGGNSYYKESNHSENNVFYQGAVERKVKTETLDSVVSKRGFPQPDLIKMDVQGAELDILRGASKTLASSKDLILELQKVHYNEGAPLREEVIDYLDTIGFKLVVAAFSDNGPDGDYHFTRA